MQDPKRSENTPERWNLHLSCGCKQTKNPPVNPCTDETAWVYWGGGGATYRGEQTAITMVVERVRVNPAHPFGRAQACSRDDSQQETGDPGHASARPCDRKFRQVLFSYAKRERCKMQERKQQKTPETGKPRKKTQKQKKQPGKRTEPKPKHRNTRPRRERKKHPATRPKQEIPKHPRRTLM